MKKYAVALKQIDAPIKVQIIKASSLEDLTWRLIDRCAARKEFEEYLHGQLDEDEQDTEIDSIVVELSEVQEWLNYEFAIELDYMEVL